ncbi:2Fe-2S iron-sulfur cluster-binding protein [Dehalobacter sp. DCM]|uniref:2Fe-2S iron-sulfur cluster-binding protein n=1 Tax=Dehalobacter sp. DCM TaxID=2907827 RepID=UPI003081DC33|nr:2Fe-2S iron-sulfur cluster-binding protein [Dehalobacter sp. DCM]
MEEFVEIVVDEQLLPVRRNIPLLQALKEKGIILPSLCYSSRLESYGSCGLCVLEVYVHEAWKVQHACMMHAEEGLRVRIRSARISWLQGRAAQLLLKRGPFPKLEVEEFLLSLIHQAEESDDSASTNTYFIKPRERTQDVTNAGCILCGLCVRMCRKIGKNRLVFLGRGKSLRVGLVDGGQPDICSYCGACRQICPTGFILHDVRQVFHRPFI